MNRGFEIVTDYLDRNINLPTRKTKDAAGYDVEAAEDITIPVFTPGIKPTLIPTGIKAYCQADEYIMLANRSSGPKKGFLMANSIGIIDHDYYNNPGNEGHIFFQYFNCSDKEIVIKKGDIIGQIVFQKFLITDDDIATETRVGGFGSTDK